MGVTILQRLPTVLASLCLSAVLSGVSADSGCEIQAQGHVTPEPGVIASPNIHGLEQAWQRPDGVLMAPGQISGTGSINVGHVIIDGTLAPGNSPGCIDFGGNVTLSATATLLTEVGGPTPCTEYDRISVAGQLSINAAKLQVVLLAYEPALGERFDIMDWSSLSGSFGTVDTSAAILPPPLIWDTSQLYLSGELVVDMQHYADGDLAPWGSPDGQVNAADVLIATQLALGLRVPGTLQFAHGDMNFDDAIDLADLLLIKQIVLQ